MDSMFNTPQEVVQANMNGAVKKLRLLKRKYSLWESWLVSASRLPGRSDDDYIYRRRIVHRRLYDDDGMY